MIMTSAPSDYTRANRRRFDEARRRHVELMMRLAQTEEQMALTLDRLAGGSSRERRAALAAEARGQACRLRAYARGLSRT